MKRVFSLILAVVMVALMIPFAAIATFAESDPFYKNWDFTTLDPLDAVNVNPRLNGEFVASYSTAEAAYQKVSEHGVSINQNNQYFGFADGTLPEDMVNGETDYVLEVTLNVATHRIRRIRFSWDDTAPTYDKETGAVTFDSDAITAISKGGTAFYWGSGSVYSGVGYRGPNSGTFAEISTTMYDSQGAEVTKNVKNEWGDSELYTDYADTVSNGIDFTFSFVIREGKLSEIQTFSEGVLVRRYVLTADYSANGYFSIGPNSGGSGTINIKNIAVKEMELENGKLLDGPIGTYSTGKVVHNVDMSKVNSVDELPYTIFQDGVNGGKVWVENGALCQSVDPKSSSGTRYNGFLIDGELFGNSDTYTLDLTIAGGSASRILFINPVMGEGENYGFSDSKSFKLRMQEEYCCDGFNTYVYNAETKDWDRAAEDVQGLPAEMIEDIKAGEDINIKMVVNNVLSAVYITVDGLTVKALDRVYDPSKSQTPGNKDLVNTDARIFTGGNGIGILQNTKAENLVAIKSIKIVSAPVYYGTDLPTTDAQITMPANTAVVKVNGLANFVKAGETYTPDANVVAQVVGGEYVAAADVVTEAGNIYSYVTASASIVAGVADLRDENDVKGIRFTAKFDAYDLQTLVDLYEAGLVKGVEVGTLITTTPWAEAAGAVTHEALTTVANGKVNYVEVMATIGDWYDVNTFAGTIYNVNAEREYQAAGFIKVTLANDTVVMVYTATTTATLASVTPVA